MPPRPRPYEHALQNYVVRPSKKHGGCIEYRIREYIISDDLESVVWRARADQAKVTLEDGHLVVENEEGVRAGLRVQRSVDAEAGITEVEQRYLGVHLPTRLD